MHPAHRRARRQVLVTAVILLLVLGLAVALSVAAAARPSKQGGKALPIPPVVRAEGAGGDQPASPEPEVVNSGTTTLRAECAWSEQRHRTECVARGTTPQGGERVTLSFNGTATGDPSPPAVHLTGGFEADNRTVDGTVTKAWLELDGIRQPVPPRPGDPERADGSAACRPGPVGVAVGLAWTAPLPSRAGSTAKRTERGIFQTSQVQVNCDGTQDAGVTTLTPNCAFGDDGQESCSAWGFTPGGTPVELKFNGNNWLETNRQEVPKLPGVQSSLRLRTERPELALEEVWLTVDGDRQAMSGARLRNPVTHGVSMSRPCRHDPALPGYPNDVTALVSVGVKWKGPGEHGIHQTKPVRLSCSGRRP